MAKEYSFKGKAFICGSRQDKDGCEIVSLKFDVRQQIEVAKFKLMGRDLTGFDPMLLDIYAKRSKHQCRSKIEKRKAKKVYR